MFRTQLPRLYELRDRASPDAYLPNFEERLQKSPHHVLQIYLQWETVLQGLDDDAWRFLKCEAARWLTSRERGWEQLFNRLNQARAYNYLKRLGCVDVRFIPPSTTPTPDLEASLRARRILCEVKTINPSSKPVKPVRARSEFWPLRPLPLPPQPVLSTGFFCKLRYHIAKAEKQMYAYDPECLARHVVYINPNVDDPRGTRKRLYFRQIDRYLSSNPAHSVELVFCNDRTAYYRTITMTAATVDNAL